MNKLMRTLLLSIFTVFFSLFAMGQSDSLVKFSDLKYQSAFEKEAIHNFVLYKRDTFNLFLAIDKNMTNKEATLCKKAYERIYPKLESKKILSKRIKRKIDLIYPAVHHMFLKKYRDVNYFPSIFQTGNYSCVDASILYALVFKHYKIPYKILVSSNHVYLVANPGKNSILIETTNLGFEEQIFNGEFRQHYIEPPKVLNQFGKPKYGNISDEELYEKNFKKVRRVKFNNLIGFQYWNKGLNQLKKHNLVSAVSLLQKACFFEQNKQAKVLLYNNLIDLIKHCNFNKVSDIDYLAEVARSGSANINALGGTFGKILYTKLQQPQKEAFCDSLLKRLTSKASNKAMINEFNFEYDLQMSYHYQRSDAIEKYVAGALAIKENCRDALTMMSNYLYRKLDTISNPTVLLDTVRQMQLRLHDSVSKSILSDFNLSGYLQKAIYSFAKNKITAGNKYVLYFEKHCHPPVQNTRLRMMVERTYNAIAQYYAIKGDKTKARLFLKREQKFVPGVHLPDIGGH